MTAGHSVLAVAVPAFEDYIQRRTAHYDASFLSSDPDFSHAHITVLGPWLPTPSQPDLDTVERIMAAAEPFDTTLARVETFPDGLIHLRPDPDEPFRALTAALVDAFPHCPPYGGRFPDPVPHLTLDRRADGITPDSVGEDLRHLLPARLHVDRVDLQWWANHDCHVRESWKLGRGR
ncbi:2'-5' RNA ligase family protein [Saccharomonospora piscinae]|uniref:2'-5' RNA ligase family protein n=1 Tax=Saccharomonospora piscinae TaxID=687388 RepID=UPI00046519D9|nr:2'-5' RNA ligase family protein [Saccharomonospora piscinae]